MTRFTRNDIQEAAWKKGITYAETNENYEQGTGLLCWNCGRFTPTNKRFTEWTCPGCLFEHRLDHAAALQQELEMAAPDIKWKVTDQDGGIEIAWEKEVGGRRLNAESVLSGLPPQADLAAIAKAIAGQVSRIQPTGEDVGPRKAYFIQDTHKAPGGGYIVCIAEEGAKGFTSANWNYGTDKSAAQVAIDGLNKRLGITRTEAFMVVSGAIGD